MARRRVLVGEELRTFLLHAQPDYPHFSAADVEKLTGISAGRLRGWHHRGLTNLPRRDKGWRRYSKSDVAVLIVAKILIDECRIEVEPALLAATSARFYFDKHFEHPIDYRSWLFFSWRNGDWIIKLINDETHFGLLDERAGFATAIVVSLHRVLSMIEAGVEAHIGEIE